MGTFDGTLTTIRAHERAPDGTPNPTYRCLFPEPPPPGTVPACAEAGVLGAMAGVLGAMMALEVIREIVGFGEGLVGRLVMLDTRSMRFETLRYAWDPANPLSGSQATIRDLSVHAARGLKRLLRLFPGRNARASPACCAASQRMLVDDLDDRWVRPCCDSRRRLPRSGRLAEFLL